MSLPITCLDVRQHRADCGERRIARRVHAFVRAITQLQPISYFPQQVVWQADVFPYQTHIRNVVNELARVAQTAFKRKQTTHDKQPQKQL